MHIEAGVEQIPPALHQMIEDRTLVREQLVVTGVELVNVGQALVGPEQIGLVLCGTSAPDWS